MEMMRVVAWLGMVSLRALSVSLFAWRFASHGDIGCGVWAAVELHALALAVVNEWRKKEADSSAWALVVPLLYLCGVFTAPTGASSAAGQGAIAISAIAVFCVRLQLGLSYSVAVSTWYRLVDAGPYRWVRHPMLLCQIVSRVVVFAEFPSVLNGVTLSFFVAAMVVVVVLEESFLMSRAEYRRYAERVRFRLLPFVW